MSEEIGTALNPLLEGILSPYIDDYNTRKALAREIQDRLKEGAYITLYDGTMYELSFTPSNTLYCKCGLPMDRCDESPFLEHTKQ